MTLRVFDSDVRRWPGELSLTRPRGPRRDSVALATPGYSKDGGPFLLGVDGEGIQRKKKQMQGYNGIHYKGGLISQGWIPVDYV